MAKLYKCPFCDRRYVDNKDAVLEHMDTKHHEDLNGLSPKQVYFNYSNRYMLTKANGKSVISGKPTPWNEVSGRYMRFLPSEKEAYRKYFLDNMKRAGKEDIMKDMEHQKMMLANRSISGKYKWTDGSEVQYTGSYERKFLECLDKILHWPSADLCAPAPQLFPYRDMDGNEHIHIPDFYLTSLNLIVNVKSAENKHYRLRDLEVERDQDNAIKASTFNYIKVYDNEFSKFMDGIDEIKQNLETGKQKRIIIESFDVDETLNILLD